MKFPNWLSQRAIQKKKAIALIFKSTLNQETERWTYSQLEVEVNHYINYLQALGIKSGDRVGLLLTNHPKYIIVIHALIKCEAIAIFLNIRLTAEELIWQIEDSLTKYLFYDEVTKTIAKSIENQIDYLIVSEVFHAFVNISLPMKNSIPTIFNPIENTHQVKFRQN